MLRTQRLDLLAQTFDRDIFGVGAQQDPAQQAIHLGDLAPQSDALRPISLEHGIQTFDLTRRQVQRPLYVRLPPPSNSTRHRSSP